MFHKSDYYLKPEEVEHYAHEVKACGPSSQATDDVNTDSAILVAFFLTSTSNFSTLVVDLSAPIADLLASIIDYFFIDNAPYMMFTNEKDPINMEILKDAVKTCTIN